MALTNPVLGSPTASAGTERSRPAFGGRASWWGDVAGGVGILLVVAVLALWVRDGGLSTLADPGGVAIATGRVTGLVASALLLIQILLMARIPWVERAWGQDMLTRRHRLVGILSFYLMLGHVVAITIGYAQAGRSALLAEFWSLVTTYPGMLLATAGTVALIVVVATSIRAARRRLRYESWHLIHLYAYLGAGLALPHQLWTGADFLSSTAATVLWWGLWASAAVSMLLFRLVRPVVRSLYHRVVVTQIRQEAAGLVSVVLGGRRLDRLRLSPGQFCHWRFLTGTGWTRAHPFSISSVPTADRLRITFALDGDDGRRLAGIRPGTRVLVEGPFGRLTAAVRSRRDVLLIGAGVGVTPLRALAEQIVGEAAAPGPGGSRPPSVVLLQRASRPDAILFAAEFAVLAQHHHLRVVPMIGHRGSEVAWLPPPLSADPEGSLTGLVPDVNDREVYLCGPSPWMDSVFGTLRRVGVGAGAVHREEFAW